MERSTLRLDADLLILFTDWAQQLNVKAIQLLRALLNICEPLLLISMPADPYELDHVRLLEPQADRVRPGSEADHRDAAILRQGIEHVLRTKGRNLSPKEKHVKLHPRSLSLIARLAYRYRTSPTQFVGAFLRVVMFQYQVGTPLTATPPAQQ
jgi:hypothetical protein